MPVNTTKIVCEKCDKRLPKNRPKLTCSFCKKIKHYKCNYLTKSDAEKIINKSDYEWVCFSCISETLPINASYQHNAKINAESENVTSTVRIKCSACNKQSHNPNNIVQCFWCDGFCHKKCVKNSLGCIRCCSSIIPGYHYNSYEMLGTCTPNNSLTYDPYNCNHQINLIGEKLEAAEGSTVWSEISNRLIQCKYTEIKHIRASKSNELKVMSLNIRSLALNVEKINQDIAEYEKFDVLCFNETNCDVLKLPNGINNIIIQGFHPPITKAPARKSCKGGGIALYINENTCNADDIEKYEFKDIDETSLEGEFLFAKLKCYKNTNRTIIIGGTYRSPSSKPDKYIEKLDNILSGLKRHKNKQILLMGDLNIDLTAYESNLCCQNLINITSNHGLIQIISKPTRVTDHSASLIDHIYTNSIQNVTNSGILTLDLSDHLGTYLNIVLNDKFDRTKFKFKANEQNFEYHKFNAENDEKFRKLIADGDWELILHETDAQMRYNKFAEIYTNLYDTAYPKVKPVRRKKQRVNPKPWILPWLEKACDRKNRLYHEYIKSPVQANKIKYMKIKKFVEKHIKNAKNKYYTDYFTHYKNDSKKQWVMINNLLHRSCKKNP